ncbi:hypothetical protein POM88_029782 [Heracleum sosnowskyi]|uniref:Uncharacterized protein n=1 Tax=Heracleum sosnowskyi TaxID=360622 RepID=A0AAD8HVI8_9APIA|nr:hypothetical protein POM88_029782 [Heracleum sosnowskyi]
MEFGISKELFEKACELANKAHECRHEFRQYLYEECHRSSPPTAVFQAIHQNSSLSAEVDVAVKEGKQLVFAEHSSGGPMAIFATLWFLDEIKKIVVPRNSDAVLELLSHSSQLKFNDQGAMCSGQIFKESLVYLQQNVEIQSVVYLDNLCSEFNKTEIMTPLNDLGLSLRAKLSLLAADRRL